MARWTLCNATQFSLAININLRKNFQVSLIICVLQRRIRRLGEGPRVLRQTKQDDRRVWTLRHKGHEVVIADESPGAQNPR